MGTSRARLTVDEASRNHAAQQLPDRGGRFPGHPVDRARAEGEHPRRKTGFIRQQRLIDEELRRQRVETAPLSERLDWQWGGWLDYYVFHFADGIQESRVNQRPGLAVWTRMRIDGGAHELFARMRLRYSYFNPGDEIERQQDWVGPNFDQAWYQINVGRALRFDGPG